MLTILTWHWGEKYDPFYVTRLFEGLRRNLVQPFRFVCVSERARISGPGFQTAAIKDVALLEVPGCFARLRMFDPEWQKDIGATDRIVCIDLDTVITGNLDPLFDRAEEFLILRGANASNPCPYNGSLMMLRAGVHPEVWSDFSVDRIKEIPHYDFPDDQGWLAVKIPDAPGWTVGAESGVYAFQKPGWPTGDGLPVGARMVTFPGWRDPSKFVSLSWVGNNWR